jgi:hypothetical protein
VWKLFETEGLTGVGKEYAIIHELAKVELGILNFLSVDLFQVYSFLDELFGCLPALKYIRKGTNLAIFMNCSVRHRFLSSIFQFILNIYAGKFLTQDRLDGSDGSLKSTQPFSKKSLSNFTSMIRTQLLLNYLFICRLKSERWFQ